MLNSDLHSVYHGLKVLAEPKRLEIIELLKQGVQCNCELGGKLNMAPNLISHHLRVLQKAGFITTARDTVDARWIYYSLNLDALQRFARQIGTFLDVSGVQTRIPSCPPNKIMDGNPERVRSTRNRT